MLKLSPTRQLLTIYLLTMLGSSLTTVAIFLSIEDVLGNTSALSFALSIRTAGFFLLTIAAPIILSKFGEVKTLLIAQASGLIALPILCLGYLWTNPWLIYAGVILTGLPSNLTSTSMIAAIKIITNDENLFRNASASREKISGATLAIAGFLIPLLLLKFSVYSIFIFDALTYIGSVVLLSKLKIDLRQKGGPLQQPFQFKDYTNSHALKFALASSGPLILMATIPVFASSKIMQNTFGLNEMYFRYLWGMEGLFALFSSHIYSFLHRQKLHKLFSVICSINSLFLVVLLLNASSAIKFMSLSLVAIAFNYLFFDLRDTLVISAQQNFHLIRVFSATGQLTRSFWGTISPFVIVYGFTTLNGWVFLSALLLIQGALALIYNRLINRKII